MTQLLRLPAWGHDKIHETSSFFVDVSQDSEFLAALYEMPKDIAEMIEPRVREVEEVVFALGQGLEVVYADVSITYPRLITNQDLIVIDTGSRFREDGRRGIDKTLHRVSRFRDMDGLANLIKFRLGRALLGVAEPFRATLQNLDAGILIIGPPGVGKTTLLRDMIRILQEYRGGKVLIIDTSLEICGEGTVPHAFIGMAHRIMVGHPERQKVMIDQAVMNGGAELLVLDEMGYRDDVELVNFAAGRGIIPVGSVHGHTLHDVLRSERLRPLLGLNKDTGRRDGLEQSSFKMAIEVRGRGQYRIFRDVDAAIQDIDKGKLPNYQDVQNRITSSQMIGPMRSLNPA